MVATNSYLVIKYNDSDKSYEILLLYKYAGSISAAGGKLWYFDLGSSFSSIGKSLDLCYNTIGYVFSVYCSMTLTTG